MQEVLIKNYKNRVSLIKYYEKQDVRVSTMYLLVQKNNLMSLIKKAGCLRTVALISYKQR